MKGSQSTSLKGKAVQQWVGVRGKVNLGLWCQHSFYPVSQKGYLERAHGDLPVLTATATVFQERYALRASPARPGVCSRLGHGLLALELSGLGSVPGELSALFL